MQVSFAQLNRRDDLNDTQAQVLEKVFSDRDRRAERQEEGRRHRKIIRLTRERLDKMAERADLNEDERAVLFQLADKVDRNARQFERILSAGEELNGSQRSIVKKLKRSFDREAEDNDE